LDKTTGAGKLAGNFLLSCQKSPIYAQILQFLLWSRELAGNLQGISKLDPKSLNINGLNQENRMMPT
jgi:hypothetical protein